MKNKEIKKYWKEEREALEAKGAFRVIGRYTGVSHAPNIQSISKKEVEEYKEHQGSTPESIAAYKKLMVDKRGPGKKYYGAYYADGSRR